MGVWIVVTEIWNAKLDVFTTTTTATIDAITMCTVHIILYLEENESNGMAYDWAWDWNPELGTDIYIDTSLFSLYVFLSAFDRFGVMLKFSTDK